MQSDRSILIGVTGGIAAYKAAELARLLVKSGASVRVAMTASASEFITPLTFQALTGNPVATALFDLGRESRITHIELARGPDIIVIAPATANFIAKMATGISDDLLSTVVLAADCPIVIAPAMNTRMFNHPVTQENLKKLESLEGYHVLSTGQGELACGEVGAGRLLEPELIAATLERIISARHDLAGIRFLVTAGPTQEPLDPVRYLTNPSSGKMGYAIAKRAAERGAEVVLISGPTGLNPPSGVKMLPVRTSAEMYQAALSEVDRAEVVVKAAAPADYRPARTAKHKIKKGKGPMMLELKRTRDILSALGRRRGKRLLVGFAAETKDLEKNAREKLIKKHLDLCVANPVGASGAGFGADTNKGMLLYREGRGEAFGPMTKVALADFLLDRILNLMKG